jgi:hypothetical protein
MSIFKKMLDESLNEKDELSDDFLETEELPTEEELPEEPIEDEEAIEEEEPADDIHLGAMVKVQDATSFTAEELGIEEDEFEDFKIKVEQGEYAIVFDIDDESPDLVDIVFEDGLEIFRIPKLVLSIVDEDAEEDVQPVEDEEVVDEEEPTAEEI